MQRGERRGGVREQHHIESAREHRVYSVRERRQREPDKRFTDGYKRIVVAERENKHVMVDP
jgi:hypothetical protein